MLYISGYCTHHYLSTSPSHWLNFDQVIKLTKILSTVDPVRENNSSTLKCCFLFAKFHVDLCSCGCSLEITLRCTSRPEKPDYTPKKKNKKNNNNYSGPSYQSLVCLSPIILLILLLIRSCLSTKKKNCYVATYRWIGNIMLINWS